MSLLSLTIYPNFPVTKNHKWRIGLQANIRSHDRSCRLKKNVNETSWSTSSNGVTPLTKRVVTSRTLLNERSDYVTAEALTSELEKKRNGGFWLREWDSIDITNLCWFTGIHVLGAYAPFVFDWGALWTAVGLAFMTGFGVTLGYHRLLSHRSFKIPRWLEYFFVYCGAHAFQRDPIFWVSVHKNHHMHSDTDRDPHTPTQGFWFSHMGWFFYNDYIASKCGESRSGEYTNVPELKGQWFYRFLQDTYFYHPIALAALLYLYGGLPYLAWGMGMRTVIAFHVTFLVGSVNHLWGDRPWNTPDTSTNHWFAGMLALGDGWHNNHHAFPKSAQHGLEWWQSVAEPEQLLSGVQKKIFTVQSLRNLSGGSGAAPPIAGSKGRQPLAGIELPDCPCCVSQPENSDDARQLGRWEHVFINGGMNGLLSLTRCRSLDSSAASECTNRMKEVAEVIAMTYFRVMWNQMNEKFYKGKMKHGKEIANLIQYFAFYWINVRAKFGRALCWDD